jgi:RHS repeat-associated protein
LEENHYFPYEMLMEGITPISSVTGAINKYKFSDKELQLDLGINQYDLGARFYDPVIGRFNVIDPLTDYAPHFTPYRFGFDNPVSFSDHTGLYEEDDDDGGPGVGKGGENELQKANFEPVYFDDCNESGIGNSLPPDWNPPTFTFTEIDNSSNEESSGNKKGSDDDESEGSQKGKGSTDADEDPGIEGQLSASDIDLISDGEWFNNALYELNKYNPIANLYNSISGYLTGYDSYGVPTDVYQATSYLILAIPIGVLAGATEKMWANYSYELIDRTAKGADGALSRHVVERLNGETISLTHQVFLENNIIHQHQIHIGTYGSERIFPEEWLLFRTIK